MTSTARIGQPVAAVGGRAAFDIGDDQHAVAIVETLDRRRQFLDFAEVLVGDHVDRLHPFGRPRKTCAQAERPAPVGVRQKKYAYHIVAARAPRAHALSIIIDRPCSLRCAASTASMNIAAHQSRSAA
jgi:hypothetical protein